MMVLITGGSGSGKSAYAEELISRISGGRRKYYLATMQVFDGETRARIERHRRQRSGKGFLTIERPVAVSGVLREIRGGAVLLECKSNLAANEMFSADPPRSAGETAESILGDVAELAGELEVFVIVTNHVFDDGILYDASTMEYCKALGSINERLAEMADRVVEVVAGIPLVLKGEERICGS